MTQTNGRISDILCWTVCHATEDPAKVRDAVEFITGKDAHFGSRKTESHFHQPMEIFSARMKGKESLARVISVLSESDLEEVIRTLEERMDDDNVLHFRLDKQSCYLHSPVLSSTLDVTERKEHDSIDVEVHAITYPGSRKNAVKFINDMLHEIRSRRQG